MKLVYVLRHAQKDSSGNLTEEGKETARKLKTVLPQFDSIIASDSPRTQETAKLLTGSAPTIDVRAGFYNASQEISDAINKLASTHPSGFTGAYLENKEIKNEVDRKAMELVNLVSETLERLPENGTALIISHDITMIPSAKLVTKNFNITSFNYLSGYIIDEEREFTLYPL